MNFVLQFFYLLLISRPWDCFHGITLSFVDIHTLMNMDIHQCCSQSQTNSQRSPGKRFLNTS